VVARGGKGGWGNTHFTSSTEQAPQIAQLGETGEELTLLLEMRLIADVGIIGYPNAGKSTLLASASAAKPKIASYPFTTLEPVVGVVEIGPQAMVLAEVPGLVDGAHLGRGLGHDFLRHAMRTRLLIHLVDGGSVSPLDEVKRINEELRLFDPSLAEKPQLLAVNKFDLPSVAAREDELRNAFGAAGYGIKCISAASGEGVPELMAEAMQRLRKADEVPARTGEAKAVFRPRPREGGVQVHKVEDTFIVSASPLERLVSKNKLSGAEIRWQLKKHFARLGIDKALQKAGAQPGDNVRCGHLEWEY